MIYLDNAATTKPEKIAIEYFLKYLNDIYANPSSMHKEGKKAKEIIENSKYKFNKIIKNEVGEVIFTYSATISNNIAIFGNVEYLKSKKNKGKIKILYSEADHPSIVEPIKSIKDIEIYDIKFTEVYKKIKNDENVQDYLLNLFYKTLDIVNPDLIVLQWVNNENGLILPIKKISEYAKSKNKNILIHVDAVQGFLKIPFFGLRNIDTISFSAHKFGGLKGSSILYINDIKRIRPIIYGGGQMHGIFPSTENVATIASTVALCEELTNNLESRLKENIKKKEKVFDFVFSNNLKDEVFLFSDRKLENLSFSPYILKIYNKRLPAQVLQNILSEKEIMVSIGSACSSNKKRMIKDSSVFGIPSEIADKGIRVSFFINESFEEIEIFCNALKQIMNEYSNW